MADIIIGSAGHVDHGKTTLVRALTGRDTDRLPEEKRRGVSIDLGFADFTLPSGRRAAVIDVPGHERFIRNMVAGVSGIDLVLLVVAADEGVMPQTVEHLDILQLLGVEHGLIVLNKVDLVDEEWLALVTEDVRQAVAGTFLAEAPLVPVSAKTGAGLEELVALIDRFAPNVRPRNVSGPVRLPIDRVFTITGFGTVVTGTLTRGRLETEMRCEIQPAGLPVRIRQLQVHGRTVTEATAGQRVAVNVTGVDKNEVRRGDVLVTPGSLRAVHLFSGWLALLPRAPKPLKNNARVRIHTGTTEAIARCLLLDREQLQPGERAYVVCRLEEPLVLARGDRYIIRSYSPMHTIGGGVILDPGKRYRRFREESLAALATLEQGDPLDVVEQAIGEHAQGTGRAQLVQALQWSEADVRASLAELEAAGRIVSVADQALLFRRDAYEALTAALRRRLDAFHRREPLRAGMPREMVRRELLPQVDVKVFAELLERWADAGIVKLAGEAVSAPDFEVRLDARLQEAQTRLLEQYEAAGRTPPGWEQAIAGLPVDPQEARALADDLVARGRLIRISDDLLFAAGAYAQMQAAVLDLLEQKGAAGIGEIRDHLATSRKYLIPLLEYLDQQQLTRRRGDQRELTARGRELARRMRGRRNEIDE